MNRCHQRNWTGNNNCLAAGVRRRHLHFAALLRHMAAALPFGLCHLGIWQKARHRGPANDRQQKDHHTDFGREIQEINGLANAILTIVVRDPNRKVTKVAICGILLGFLIS